MRVSISEKQCKYTIMVRVCAVINCPHNNKTLRARKFSENNVSLHSFPTDAVGRAAWVRAMGTKSYKVTYQSYLCSNHFEPGSFEKRSIFARRMYVKEGVIPSIFNNNSLQSDKVVKLTGNAPAVRQPQQEEIINACSSFQPHNDPRPQTEIHVKLSVSQREQQIGDIRRSIKMEKLDELNDQRTDQEFVDIGRIKVENDTAMQVPTPYETSSPPHVRWQGSQTVPCNNPLQLEREKDEPGAVDNIESGVKKSNRKRFLGDFSDADMECPVKAKLCRSEALEIINVKNKQIKTLRQQARRYRKKIFRLEQLSHQLREKNNA